MTEIQSASDAAEARAEHRFAVLRELADIGMALARDVGRQAAAAAAEAHGAVSAAAPREAGARGVDFGLLFARISRAVRQTLALEAKFDEARRARREAAEAERVVETRLRGLKRKNQAGNIIEAMLDEKDEADAERLSDALHESLADADDSDFADRPLGEIVAAICRDLGVSVDWSLWEDEPWAAEARKAERPDAADPAPPGGAWPPPAPPGEPPIALSG